LVDANTAPGFGGIVKNITLSLDDETYRRARIKAAEQDTSVSALVRSFLIDLAAGESENERQERKLREAIMSFRAGDRLSRDAVHRRPE
jgi:plasmid stability protein